MQKSTVEGRRREMRFAGIMPISCFSIWGDKLDSHMVLAQFCHLEPYLKFYQTRVEKGDLVILDNGAYEGESCPPKQLHRITQELKPTVVVLPDRVGSFVGTVADSFSFLDRGLPTDTDGMLVLHGKNFDELEKLYNLNPVGWVGFPRMHRGYPNWPFHRWMLASKLKPNGVKRHALGMLDGDTNELQNLEVQGFYSVDSSAPIWRGLHGYELGDPNWGHIGFYPECTSECWSAQGLQVAEKNLQRVLEACR
jgi:hypothetical protein